MGKSPFCFLWKWTTTNCIKINVDANSTWKITDCNFVVLNCFVVRKGGIPFWRRRSSIEPQLCCVHHHEPRVISEILRNSHTLAREIRTNSWKSCFTKTMVIFGYSRCPRFVNMGHKMTVGTLFDAPKSQFSSALRLRCSYDLHQPPPRTNLSENDPPYREFLVRSYREIHYRTENIVPRNSLSYQEYRTENIVPRISYREYRTENIVLRISYREIHYR